MESQLFGHEPEVSRVLRRCERATLNLPIMERSFDEIGEMPLDVQPKLLRALQERVITKVGGEKPIPVDIRLISATSKDIPSKVKSGEFRWDVYYRINTVQIDLFPLRERKEELAPDQGIPQEALAGSRTAGEISVSEEAIKLLEDYSFPGNVRELLNLTERIVINKGTNSLVFPEDIEPYLQPGTRDGVDSTPVDAGAANRIAELENEVADLRRQPADGQLTLRNVAERFGQIRISPNIPVGPQGRSDPKDDPLWGIKPTLEEALHQLLKRIAGAALEGTKHFAEMRRRTLTRYAGSWVTRASRCLLPAFLKQFSVTHKQATRCQTGR